MALSELPRLGAPLSNLSRLLQNVSVRTQLSGAYGLSLFLTVLIGLIALFQLSAFERLGSQFTQQWLPQVEILGELKRAMTEHRLLAERRTETRDFRQLVVVNESMDAASAAVDTTVHAYRKTGPTKSESRLLDGFVGQWTRYKKVFQDVVTRLNSGDPESGLTMFRQSAIPVFDSAAHRMEGLLELSNVRGAQAAEAVQASQRRFFWLTITVIGFALLSAALKFVWITHSISGPIRRVSDAITRISDGDDTVQIASAEGRKDEIGMLLKAAEKYRDSLVLSRQLAERLDAAVNNMPVGLSMFDADNRLILNNNRMEDMYNLPPGASRAGTHFSEILKPFVERTLRPLDDPSGYIENLLARIARREPYSDLLELRDGRTISVLIQPVQSGGWVSVHDDITARRKVEEQVAYMARHDSLTDLPNRHYFREQMGAALEQLGEGESLAVLCLDLDRFKAVNDTLGHPIGDALLCLVGERLRDAVRAEDTVGRLGGDEFAVVQVGADQPVSATTLAERIISKISEPYEIEGHRVISGTSIGVAVAPIDGSNPDQLLKNADMALYRAKSDSRGTYRFFAADMDARMQARRGLELDLRLALVKKEFELHYQPQLNLRTNEITGFEALLRWNHPGRQKTSPAEFIPLAEEIGLIIPIGRWVLSQACQDAVQWPKPLRIAVNLSPAQFKDPNLLQSVKDALAASGLAPDRLELEITETVLLRDTESVLATLHEFRELGVRVSMDDFGTGYSSLSYLRSFPFDKIKIDQSFVRDLGAKDSSIAIIRAVSGLGSSLGMETTAEGVETVDQLMRVRQEGCTEVQGFLIGVPQPASEIAELLRSSGLGEIALAAPPGRSRQRSTDRQAGH